MKKNIICFAVFVAMLYIALGFTWYLANRATNPTGDREFLEWYGHVENEYGSYDGALIGDLFAGSGSFRFLTGEVYVGDWHDSFMSGIGTLTFPEVGEYTGELIGSMRNGEGVFTWYSGERYEGTWKDDKMAGTGTYRFPNGCVLEGVFEENKPVSGKLSYQAESAKGVSDTQILSLVYTFSETEELLEFTTKGGLIYEGDVSALLESGEASITYPSGNTYTGQLLQGKREGSGKYTWKDESGEILSYYEGEWTSDHMNGSGKYHYSGSVYPYLAGSFENDLPTGTLVYYKEAGNTFDTEWANGTCVGIKET